MIARVKNIADKITTKKPAEKKPAKKYKGSMGNGMGKVSPGKKVTY